MRPVSSAATPGPSRRASPRRPPPLPHGDVELRTLVIYDVEDDRVRLRVARTCRDYGLAHVQYSAFSGPLSAARRREMCARLADTLGTSAGRLLVVPVCEKDVAEAREFFNPPQT